MQLQLVIIIILSLVEKCYQNLIRTKLYKVRSNSGSARRGCAPTLDAVPKIQWASIPIALRLLWLETFIFYP